MLKAIIRIEKPIRAVLQFQNWDESVRQYLTPTEEDWTIVKQVVIFFDIFRRPTVQSQADKYPTLYNVIPDYLHILRQLEVWKLQDDKPFL
jgi:hypothetical protein